MHFKEYDFQILGNVFIISSCSHDPYRSNGLLLKVIRQAIPDIYFALRPFQNVEKNLEKVVAVVRINSRMVQVKISREVFGKVSFSVFIAISLQFQFHSFGYNIGMQNITMTNVNFVKEIIIT